jgi:hypothetical protein
MLAFGEAGMDHAALDRATILARLARAEGHVIDGERQLARQREIVAQLEDANAGHSETAKAAPKFLYSVELAQRGRIAINRNRRSIRRMQNGRLARFATVRIAPISKTERAYPRQYTIPKIEENGSSSATGAACQGSIRCYALIRWLGSRSTAAVTKRHS